MITVIVIVSLCMCGLCLLVLGFILRLALLLFWFPLLSLRFVSRSFAVLLLLSPSSWFRCSSAPLSAPSIYCCAFILCFVLSFTFNSFRFLAAHFCSFWLMTTLIADIKWQAPESNRTEKAKQQKSEGKNKGKTQIKISPMLYNSVELCRSEFLMIFRISRELINIIKCNFPCRIKIWEQSLYGGNILYIRS